MTAPLFRSLDAHTGEVAPGGTMAVTVREIDDMRNELVEQTAIANALVDEKQELREKLADARKESPSTSSRSSPSWSPPSRSAPGWPCGSTASAPGPTSGYGGSCGTSMCATRRTWVSSGEPRRIRDRLHGGDAGRHGPRLVRGAEVTYLVARIEHAVRRTAAIVKRALAETCSGFSDYESGDYLTDEQAMSIAIEETRAMRRERAERTRQQRVDQEAEEEVAEPAPCNDIQPDFPGFACTKRHGHDGDHGWEVHGTYWPQIDAEAEQEVAESETATEQGLRLANEAIQFVGREAGKNRYAIEDMFRLLNEQYDECTRCGHMRRAHGQPYAATRGVCWQFVEPKSSVPPAEDDPAAGTPEPAVGSPTVPAGSDAPEAASPAGIPWVDWAMPAICEVLAEHQAWLRTTDDGYNGCVYCYGSCFGDDCAQHGMYGDQQAWRDHVAPLIAERLDTAWRAKQSRNAMETGRDMGSSFAAAFFPQHQKHAK